MLKDNTLIKNLSYGITAFLFIFSYSLCFAVSLQLNIWYALVTAITSSLISVTLKSEILAPDTFFTVPLLLVLSSGTNSLLPFTVIGGGLIFLFLNKKCVYRSRRTKNANLDGHQTNWYSKNLAYTQWNLHFYQIHCV